MMKIASGPPPRTDEATASSDAFTSFLDFALVRDPEERPAAAQLLAHPFVRLARGEALKSLVDARLAADREEKPSSPRRRSSDGEIGTMEKTMVL